MGSASFFNDDKSSLPAEICLLLIWISGW